MCAQGSDWQPCFGAWLPPHYAHRLDCEPRTVAVFYFDPLRYGVLIADGVPRVATLNERWTSLARSYLRSALPSLMQGSDLASTEARCIEDILPRVVGQVAPASSMLARDVRDVLRAIPIQELDLKRASRELTLSSSRFSHLFSHQFGVSWTAYRNWQRLMHVCAELARAPESITQLAHAWGFSSHAHLSASLRTGFGLTPSELRALRPRVLSRAHSTGTSSSRKMRRSASTRSRGNG